MAYQKRRGGSSIRRLGVTPRRLSYGISLTSGSKRSGDIHLVTPYGRRAFAWIQGISPSLYMTTHIDVVPDKFMPLKEIGDMWQTGSLDLLEGISDPVCHISPISFNGI